MGIDIAIDPGMGTTAACVFRDGKVIERKSLIPPSHKDSLTRLLWLRRHLVLFFDSYSPIERIAVEKFEGYNTWFEKNVSKKAGFNKKMIIPCAKVAGMILGLAEDWCKEVMEVSKGGISNQDSALLARGYGLPQGNHHEDAAFQIGVCAGFDRKRQLSEKGKPKCEANTPRN